MEEPFLTVRSVQKDKVLSFPSLNDF